MGDLSILPLLIKTLFQQCGGILMGVGEQDCERAKSQKRGLTYNNEFMGSMAPAVGGTFGDFGRNVVRFSRWLRRRMFEPTRAPSKSRQRDLVP